MAWLFFVFIAAIASPEQDDVVLGSSGAFPANVASSNLVRYQRKSKHVLADGLHQVGAGTERVREPWCVAVPEVLVRLIIQYFLEISYNGYVFYEKPAILHDFEFVSAAAARDYKKLPVDAQTAFGHDFHELQIGREAESSKVLSHFGSAKVRELIFEDETGTYRAVYTVEYPGVIYELHAFKKKSKSGIATDKADIDKIESRLREADAKYRARLQAQQGGKP